MTTFTLEKSPSSEEHKSSSSQKTSSANIEKHCGESALKVAELLQSAATRVQQGGIAIGEDHAQPHARALVLDLVEAGLVKDLYLEMPDFADSLFGGNDMTLGRYLRKLAAEKKDVTKDEHWEYIRTVLTYGCAHKNDIPLAVFVQKGIPRGTNIYLWDHPKPPKPITSPKSMKARNRYLARHYSPTHATIGSKTHAVVLTGSAHLRGAWCGEDEYTVQQLCGIAQNAVFDLGNLSKKK